MRRRLAPLAAAALLAAGCGSSGDDEGTEAAAPSPPCSDSAFRLQDEELYVAQATAQNAARSGIGPDELTLQLRQGIRALRARIAEHPPCAVDLQGIAALEAQALDGLENAVEELAELEPGDPVPPGIRQAIERELERLQEAQRRLAT